MRITGWLGIAVLVASCRQSPSTGAAYFSPPPTVEPTVARSGLGPRIAAAMHAEYESQGAAPAISLKSDGSELTLESIEAKVEIDGPLARTELHFTFHNPEARIREGKFSLVLPDDAAVSRLAMLVHGNWREARVVSREQGREVFDALLQRRIDPALLEQDAGNMFSARVFPIMAGEHKQIIVGYDHRIAEGQPYVLPLAGLAPKHLHVAIDHDGQPREIERTGAADDIVIAPRGGSLAVERDGNFVARVEMPETAAAAPFGRTLILVDTSASRTPVMAQQAEALRRVVRALPASTQVTVMAYDNGITHLYSGVASGAPVGAIEMLSHGALGASRLDLALEDAARWNMDRLLIIGDGVATAGVHEPAKLAALVAGKVGRIDAIQVGQTVDRAVLAAIVQAGREPGAIVDARSMARAMRQLTTRLPRELPIRVTGATASWPATTRGVAPGDPVWVYGRRSGAGPLAIRIGDREVALKPTTAKGQIARAVAKAEVAALSEQLVRAAETDRPAIAQRLETLALEHFLVSPRTSLIVLESDADEQRYLGSTRAPTIDPGSTKQGITIDKEYIQNIPAGRTFAGVLGSAAGTQSDVSLAGGMTHENVYLVEGLATIDVASTSVSRTVTYTVSGPTAPYLRADVTTRLAQDLVAERLNGSAFAFQGLPATTRRESYRHEPWHAPAHDGELRAIVEARQQGDSGRALELANAWQLKDPGDVAAIIALGESLEARGAMALAARAYGSLVDLYPNRVELLRTAGERLDRVASRHAPTTALAIEAYQRAVRERPDHATTYRLLAWALVRANRLDDALDALGAGLAHAKLPGAQRILGEDAGLVAAAIVARAPHRRSEVMSRMRYGIPDQPSTRFVLSWESDANDVDLVVRDRFGGRASAKQNTVPGTGGELTPDVTTGYGPEMFVASPSGFPYTLAAHYARKGAMGLGLGTVQVIHHDGRGKLVVEHRPFVIQNDNGLLELGEVRAR